MQKTPCKLRVLFVAGTLGWGGAEKQLFYMAQALQQAGAIPIVLSLTQDEFYEHKLHAINIPVEYVGNNPSRLRRLYEIQRAVRRFKPHIVQSGHFYVNIYTAISAYACRAVSIGSIRGDAYFEMSIHGLLGTPSLRLPQALIANSWNARSNAIDLGAKENKIYVAENVIDLDQFDQMAVQPSIKLTTEHDTVIVITIARLSWEKRLDRLINALSIVRDQAPHLKIKSIIIGVGAEGNRLKNMAHACGFDETSLLFLGNREDIPALLKQARIFVLTSEHEGFPNVLLEAMAAGLPVITTPAGDAGRVVENGVTGLVVGHDDNKQLAEYLIRMITAPELCKSMGEAGRRRVEQVYNSQGLAERLLNTYVQIFRQQNQFKMSSIASELLEKPSTPT